MVKDPVHILLIEDEEAHAELVRRSFEDTADSIRLATVSSLEQAFQHLAKSTPDLVIVDWVLPDGRGDEILSFRKGGALPFPVIVMTSHGDEGIAVEVMKKGALDYVVKSEHAFGDMAHMVRHALREWEAITRTREAERKLRESEARLKEAQEIAHLGYWDLDLLQDVLTWSDEVYRIFGLNPQSFGGKLEDFLSAVHPEDRERVSKAYDESIKNRETYDIIHRIVRPDGEIRYVHEQCRTHYDSAGEPTRSLGTVLDVTERQKAEEKLQETVHRLQMANKELQQFTHVSYHDLKEPLRTITITLQSLERRYSGKLGNEGDTLIQYAVDGARRLIELMDDLLAYSRVDSDGKPHLPVDAGEALTSAVRNLQVAIEESGARITYDSMPKVKANPALLTLVFQNLLSNAIKFRGERVPSIHVSAWREGGEWFFSVRDNGIGIEPEYFDKIFVVFQRLHKTSEYPGTGIGLAIVKKIVESHKGRLWVESELGRGSTFYFALST